MKRFLFIAGIVFAITLAIVIGARLSTDAMGILVGIVAGVMASIPPMLILFWVLRQRDRQFEAHLNQMQPTNQYPPVVVVNGQAPNGTNGAYPPQLTSGAPTGARTFKVVGQENTEKNGDTLPPFWDEL